MSIKPYAECMADPALFGKTFGGATFAGWRTWARIEDALPPQPGDLELYKRLTDRAEWPTQPFGEVYLIKPRRAGGTLYAAGRALHAAIQDYRQLMGPGEYATVALIASDRKQARQAFNYVKGLIGDSPLIAAEVEGDTAESITFKHRSALEIHTTSWRSTRGYSYAAVVLDELAFYRSDDSANPDVELVRAVRPGLANLKGRLFGLSSPHSRRGHLFEMHRQHFGQASSVLVGAASHSVLNPTIDQAIIDKAMADDPIAARSEWFGEFRSDTEQFLPDALIDEAIIADRRELPCMRGRRYVAFCDPSGGAHDSMTLAIAHQEASERAEYCILDQVRIAKPPFDPETVVREFSALLQRFGVRSVTGDRYAGEWVPSAFKKCLITYETAELDKSAIYLESLPLFTQKRVELLDCPPLLTELRLLERRPRPGGRGDAVDHPPRGHDDISNAACGALWRASKRRPMGSSMRAGGPSRPAYALT